jgi:hypothetical protein
MRCAAIHRKLGTHISKVKSLSMDSWSNEQVDVWSPTSEFDRVRTHTRSQNMRKVGNVVSNRVYNPENKRPPVPVDVDEADSAMERFIRQKYSNNVVNGGAQPHSPRSDEGVPPPLPPKNSKFSFKGASSIFPLSSRSKKEPKPVLSPGLESTRSGSSHSSGGKPSKFLGATISYDDADDTERKLARLRDMGFQDTQRNIIVLKGVNGNLERAIEALVRLGEGDGNPPAPPPRDASLRATKSMTPLNSSSGGLGLGAGLSLSTRAGREQPATPSSVSTNPFDNIPPAQPQTAQSTGTLQNKNPYNTSTNPFGAPAQQPDPFQQAFQNMSISNTQQSQQSQQPLFPHHTGGVVSQPQTSPAYPPVPSLPTSPVGYLSGNYSAVTYPQPGQMQVQATGYNPFLTHQAGQVQQQSPPQNLSINTMPPQPAFANNPFARAPGAASPTTLGQIPEQSQPLFQSPTSPWQAQPTGTNPFFSSPVQSPTHQPQNPYGQQQSLYPQRADKASIMALYGAPQTVPVDRAQTFQPASIPENQAVSAQQSLSLAQPFGAPQRSMTQPNPPTSSNNPFLNSMPTSPVAEPTPSARQISRESMNLGLDLAWTNGRHSPDAFASLSARHG